MRKKRITDDDVIFYMKRFLLTHVERIIEPLMSTSTVVKKRSLPAAGKKYWL